MARVDDWLRLGPVLLACLTASCGRKDQRLFDTRGVERLREDQPREVDGARPPEVRPREEPLWEEYEADSEHCPAGGTLRLTGRDLDGNGRLGPDEIVETRYQCDPPR